MIYITGDTHGQFGRIEEFCEQKKVSREDILIILGDAGVNFSGQKQDSLKKRFLESLPITLFCIHGNHEQRPHTIEGYKEKTGMVAQFTMKKNTRICSLQKMGKCLIWREIRSLSWAERTVLIKCSG